MKPEIKDLPAVALKNFLKDQKEVDESLASAASGALKEFRKDALAFLERLVDELVGCSAVTSVMGRSLSCFCCDVLVGGDDSFIFNAFGEFVKCLHLAGRLSSGQVEEATNEFKSFVVEVRGTTRLPSVRDVQDSLAFILSFPSVFSKPSLLTVSIIVVCNFCARKERMFFLRSYFSSLPFYLFFFG